MSADPPYRAPGIAQFAFAAGIGSWIYAYPHPGVPPVVYRFFNRAPHLSISAVTALVNFLPMEEQEPMAIIRVN
jgi:hypothetical protein